MNWKEFTEKHKILQPGEEPGFRDEFLNKVVVDVVQRDVDFNIIVYLMPGEPPGKIGPAVQKTCIDVFGHKKSELIDPIFYPQGVGIEAGPDRGTFDSFCIVISPPLTLRYTLGGLKDEFTRRLWHHLFQ